MLIGKLVQAWRAPQTASRLNATFSLHPSKILDNLGASQHKKTGRPTWSFSSPLDQGGAPGLDSFGSQEASPLQFYDALEEVLPGESELEEAPHIAQFQAEISSLRIDVANLVLLIQSDNFNKNDHNILELRTNNVHNHDECVRERACRDKFAKTTCSLEADKQKGEHNRVDFPKQQQ